MAIEFTNISGLKQIIPENIGEEHPGFKEVISLFLDWIRKYHTYSDLPKYSLKSIAYADRSHRRNSNWRKHLDEISKTRLNITTSFKTDYYFIDEDCEVSHPDGMLNLNIRMDLFNSIIEKYGFSLITHNRQFWTKGTDIYLLKEYSSNYIYNYSFEPCSIFIVVNDFSDSGDKEPPKIRLQ